MTWPTRPSSTRISTIWSSPHRLLWQVRLADDEAGLAVATRHRLGHALQLFEAQRGHRLSVGKRGERAVGDRLHACGINARLRSGRHITYAEAAHLHGARRRRGLHRYRRGPSVGNPRCALHIVGRPRRNGGERHSDGCSDTRNSHQIPLNPWRRG
jgi:hypothetical protein